MAVVSRHRITRLPHQQLGYGLAGVTKNERLEQAVSEESSKQAFAWVAAHDRPLPDPTKRVIGSRYVRLADVTRAHA